MICVILLIMFSILQWNARSIRAHGSEFKKFIYELDDKPDIICIQETWLKKSHYFKLNGYDFFRQDRNIDQLNGGVCPDKSGGGGCGIFVKHGLQTVMIDNVDSCIEHQIIEVFSPDNFKKLYIVNMYNTNSKLCVDQLNDIIDKVQFPAIFCADINGHNELWGSEFTDHNGFVIDKIIENFDLISLNDGTGTRLDSSTGKLSHIDITLVSKCIAVKCDWSVLMDRWGSDHFPIMIKMGVNIHKCSRNFTPKWSFKRVNWEQFALTCEEYIMEPDISDSVDNVYDRFVDQLTCAANKTVPKTKPPKGNRNPVPWWNELCDQAIRARNKACNRLQRSRHPDDFIHYKKMCALARKTVKQAKRDDWYKFCSTINSGSDTASVWNKIGKISHSKIYRSLPTLKIDNDHVITDLDKANVLADTFAAVSSNNGHTPEFQKIKDKKEAEFCFKDSTDNLLDEPFTIDELDEAIDSAKCTSPGKDNISMQMVKHLPISAKKFLLIIFNYIWHVSQCPGAWKEAILTPILKPGKDASNPSSYRPIALTSTLCKTMERMVNKRLVWFLESRNLLDSIQSGFRKNRRTTDHLVALESAINKGFSNSESTVAVFLDISKAYDMVWRRGAVIKLQVIGIRGKMVKWIDNFLSNRTIQVRVAGVLSSVRILDNGVPQGSVISPLIFNIMVNDIPSAVKCRISQFADDIALWLTGKNIKFITGQMQQNIDGLVAWCKQWGFQLSAPKTVGVLFTQKKSIPKISLKLDGVDIKFEPYAKFLGLFFDQRLTWKKHIEYVVGKCKARINLLRCVSSLNWGVDGKIMYNLYCALIRSVVDYGCESLASASKSVLSKLDSIQYQSLKICAGAICRTSLAKLQVECGDPPLYLRRDYLTQCYGLAIKSNPSHPNQHLLSDCWQKHFFADKWKSSNFHTPFEGRCGIVDRAVFDSSFIYYPYWFLKKVDVSFVIHDLVSSKDPWMMREIAVRYINSSCGNMLHIYTDGSVEADKGAVGSGFCIPHFKFTKGFRLPAGISIFSAELIAILMALDWVQDVKPLNSCIFSDSMSALQAISVFASTNKIVWEIQFIVYSLKIQGFNVCFEWVPSHCDLVGNECADLVAKKAAFKNHVDISVPFSIAEFKSQFKAELKKGWQNEWNLYGSGDVFKIICPKIGFDMANWNVNRRDETTLHRLRLGICYGLNHFQFLINKHPDGRCDICGCVDTVTHFLTECKKYDRQRVLLIDSCKDRGQTDFSVVGLLGGSNPPFKDVIKFVRECHIII